MIRSSIVPGTLQHSRSGPRSHSFNYRHTMLLIELSDLGKDHGLPWPLNHNKVGIFSIHDHKYLDSSTATISEKLGKLLLDSNSNSIIEPTCKLFMLTTPSVLGYTFNPAVFYLVLTTDGKIKAAAVEVNNTFGESHLYLLGANKSPGTTASYRTEKRLHVSPFLDRSGNYKFVLTITDQVIDFAITLCQMNQQIIASRFIGTPVPLTKNNLLKSLPRIVMSVALTELRILGQAQKLFIKIRLPIFAKPVPLQGTNNSPSEGFISKINVLFDRLRKSPK